MLRHQTILFPKHSTGNLDPKVPPNGDGPTPLQLPARGLADSLVPTNGSKMLPRSTDGSTESMRKGVEARVLQPRLSGPSANARRAAS